MRGLNFAGYDLIQSFEELRLTAYDDARPNYYLNPGDPIMGTLTIGWGHTGPDVVIGMTITEQEADELLEADLEWACKAVEELVKVPLNDNEFAALVSFTYNVGRTQFANSTLLRLLNQGDYGAVPSQLVRWDKTTINNKKVQSKGLARRRAAEIELWTAPVEGEDVLTSLPSPVLDKRPSDSLTLKGVAVSTIAATGSILTDAASQIQALGDVSPYIQGLVAILFMAGVGMTVYGRMRVMWEEGR